MEKYIFRLENGTIEYVPYFSIEDISKMWFDSGGSSTFAGYGSVFKPGDTWGNYILMITSMLLRWQQGKLGTGDSDLDNKLANDFIMARIYILYSEVSRHKSSFMKVLARRKLVVEYKETRKLVDSYASGDNAWLTTRDIQRIEPIFKAIEKKLALSKE